MSGLFGSRVLEAALGLSSVYLLLAIFCSTVNEWIAALLGVRSTMLRKGIGRLLGVAAAQFYAHPMIQALMHDGAHPENIPKASFAKVVMALATPNQPGSIAFEDLERGIANDLAPGPLRTSLLAVIQGGEKRLDSAHQAIEAWFDDAMAVVSNRYRRRAQLWTAIIAAAVTVAANADTLRLAIALLSGNPAGDALGWHAAAATWRGPAASWIERLTGWMLTAVAVSLGTPFWFDAARNLLALTRARPTSRQGREN